jgi:3'-phosphoadenosine 5'-phosphosulfate sulfotransferase (PAPS reductase)/FAD synthetase
MSILAETQRVLETARARADSILVAYSGGKDSKVVLDLCLRTFKRVEAFHMALVPGLDCIEQELEETRRKYGIKIRIYPHWLARKLIANGVFTNTYYTHDDLPEWKLADVYALAMVEAGIDTIMTGAKKSDSSWRARFMSTFRPDGVLNPIAGWHKYDVLAYLRAHGIPEPPSSGHSATGIDLSSGSLLWLHDAFPADFEKLCRVFPFAEAVIWKRKFYGEC